MIPVFQLLESKTAPPSPAPEEWVAVALFVELVEVLDAETSVVAVLVLADVFSEEEEDDDEEDTAAVDEDEDEGDAVGVEVVSKPGLVVGEVVSMVSMPEEVVGVVIWLPDGVVVAVLVSVPPVEVVVVGAIGEVEVEPEVVSEVVAVSVPVPVAVVVVGDVETVSVPVPVADVVVTSVDEESVADKGSDRVGRFDSVVSVVVACFFTITWLACATLPRTKKIERHKARV